jgi:hypothetical protein
MEHFIVMEKDTRVAVRVVMPCAINYTRCCVSLSSFSIVTNFVGLHAFAYMRRKCIPNAGVCESRPSCLHLTVILLSLTAQ